MMTDDKVLRLAFAKAGGNGDKFCLEYLASMTSHSSYSLDTISRVACFRHDFAKAFWGEEEIKIPPPPKGERRAYVVACDWKYHLQQMVLEENLIDYLRKFIEEDDQD